MFKKVIVQQEELDALYDELYELYSDFADLPDDEIIEIRDCMKDRVSSCLAILREIEEKPIKK